MYPYRDSYKSKIITVSILTGLILAEGIELLEDAGRYFLQYDAGAHMIKKKESVLQQMKLKYVN